MGQRTGISWTDHTFNPWWGCVKVSPGCASCYAEKEADRRGWQVWGKDTARRFFGEKHWSEPYRWDRAAARAGRRARVFCASMADVFEDRPDLEASRDRLWRLILDTPNLDWQLLTKRPENIGRMLPSAWRAVPCFPPNLWLGTSAEDQARADERIPHLLAAPGRVRFVSAEPLLGPVELSAALPDWDCPGDTPVRIPGIDWVIIGGESGHRARVCRVEWVRALLHQCQEAGVAVFVKQLGRVPESASAWAPGDFLKVEGGYRVLLEDAKGADPAQWPEDLRVMEFPG